MITDLILGPVDYEAQADAYETYLNVMRLTAPSALKSKQKFGLQIIKPKEIEIKEKKDVFIPPLVEICSKTTEESYLNFIKEYEMNIKNKSLFNEDKLQSHKKEILKQALHVKEELKSKDKILTLKDLKEKFSKAQELQYINSTFINTK